MPEQPRSQTLSWTLTLEALNCKVVSAMNCFNFNNKLPWAADTDELVVGVSQQQSRASKQSISCSRGVRFEFHIHSSASIAQRLDCRASST